MTETVLELPKALLIGIVPVGLFIASLQFLFRMIDSFNEHPAERKGEN
ncbi:hypothetical protein JOC94_004707 [Bacillus thermophilus]|uniref:Acridine resistance protein Z n=1 Tax=Siminovitchia thermophila TaxID=1245522 RepID=A0ABS2RGF7_9BACI|nr:hypothetical protein [Siminovitchia thermophila]MBM7717676.1 hypothetical protein [Siminovitchia thermophila]